MSHLTLKLLGSPEIEHGGQTAHFRTRKSLALLVYLAVEGGMHPREQLAELFWPNSDSVHGRAALRLALVHLREALAEPASSEAASHLIVERDRLGLNLTKEVELDLHMLAAAIQVAEPPGATGRYWRAQLEAAVTRYRGDFLAGFALDDAPEFDTWASIQRETWRHRMEMLLERLSQAQFAGGDVGGAIETTRRWLALSPLDEAAYQRLMRLYEAAGDRSAALQTYATCQSRLRDELQIAPSAETVAVAERIRTRQPAPSASIWPGPQAGSPAARTIAAPTYFESSLLGREAELEALTQRYHGLSANGAELVVVVGESGIGKTRLLTEFLRWAAAQGADILQGRAFEAGGHIPYQPLVDALRSRVDQENAPDDLLSDVWLAELSRLLPELRDRYPDLPLPLPLGEMEARGRLFEAVALLGLALAQRAPLVVWIDDLQWADVATRDLLHYAARRWRASGGSILLILCLRAEDLASTPRLAEWIGAMWRELPAARVTLQPLTAEDTLRLVEQLAGDCHTREDLLVIGGPSTPGRSPAVATFSQWLYTETRGQPFYIMETLKALIERGVVALQLRGDGVWSLNVAAFGELRDLRHVIPPGVRDVIRSRLAPLNPPARVLLAAAAILGRSFDFEQVRQLAELPENDALAALDEVAARALVREDTEGLTGDAAYVFTHDRIRDVVYAEAGAARRQTLHRRALAILQTAEAPPAELAYHALAARLSDEAVRWSTAAGDAALRVFALHDALSHYEQARRLVETGDGRFEMQGARPADLQHLYLQLGRGYELTSDFARSREVYEALLRLGQQRSDPATECAALNHLATLTAQETADLDAATTLLRQAQRVAEASSDRIWLAETEWNLAQIRYYAFDTTETLVHGERALALARELGEPELTARSLNVIAYAEWFTHRSAMAEAHADEARDLYAALGNHAMEADCLNLLAHARLDRGQIPAALLAAHAAQAISRAFENQWGQVFSTVTLSLGLLQHGSYGEALEVARRGAQLVQPHGPPLLRGLHLLCLGAVQRTLGALDAARAAHLAALAVVEEMGAPLPLVAMSAAELCADCVEAGEWDGAETYALEVLTTGDQGYPMLPGAPTIWYESVALVRAGRHEQARQHVQRFAGYVDENARYRVAYLRAQATLAEMEGAAEQACAYLYEAARLAETLGLPGEQWQIGAALGALHHAQGDEEQARQAITGAAELRVALAQTIDDDQLRALFLGSTAAVAHPNWLT